MRALPRREPRGVGREGLEDDPPVLVLRVSPEIRLDRLVFMKVAQGSHDRGGPRPLEVVVTGDSEQEGA